MRFKKILVFVMAASVSTAAASYRWSDSGHTIGLVSQKGGRVRHPAELESGKHRYTQIVTATVLPPYHGDARVVLEGAPPLESEIYLAGPIINLKLRRTPVFENHVLKDLRPGDRIALWLVMRPAANAGGVPERARMCSGKYTLALYDTQSGRPVLRAPIILKGKE